MSSSHSDECVQSYERVECTFCSPLRPATAPTAWLGTSTRKALGAPRNWARSECEADDAVSRYVPGRSRSWKNQDSEIAGDLREVPHSVHTVIRLARKTIATISAFIAPNLAKAAFGFYGLGPKLGRPTP